MRNTNVENIPRLRDNKDIPHYVLAFKEVSFMEKSSDKKVKQRRIVAILVLVLGVFLAYTFHYNIFTEMNLASKIIAIAAFLYVFFSGGKSEEVPTDIELRFYEDYLVVYRPNAIYGKKRRREYEKMKYSEIKRGRYSLKGSVFSFEANILGEFYNFDKQGNLSELPDYNRYTVDGLCYFGMQFAEDIDFKKEIEEHSPIKVEVLSD